jgi:hypothetical protein
MPNPTKTDLKDLILSFGLPKFFDALREVCLDNIKTIDERFPRATPSRQVWFEIVMHCEKIKEML